MNETQALYAGLMQFLYRTPCTARRCHSLSAIFLHLPFFYLFFSIHTLVHFCDRKNVTFSYFVSAPTLIHIMYKYIIYIYMYISTPLFLQRTHSRLRGRGEEYPEFPRESRMRELLLYIERDQGIHTRNTIWHGTHAGSRCSRLSRRQLTNRKEKHASLLGGVIRTTSTERRRSKTAESIKKLLDKSE